MNQAEFSRLPGAGADEEPGAQSALVVADGQGNVSIQEARAVIARRSRKAGMISCSETWPSSASRHQSQGAVGSAGVEGLSRGIERQRADGRHRRGLEQRTVGSWWSLRLSARSPRGPGGHSRMRFSRQQCGAGRRNLPCPCSSAEWPGAAVGPSPQESWRGYALCMWAGSPGRDAPPSRRPPRPAKSYRPTRPNYRPPGPTRSTALILLAAGQPRRRGRQPKPGSCRSTDRGTRRSRHGSRRGRPGASPRSRPSRCPRPPRQSPPARPAADAPRAVPRARIETRATWLPRSTPGSPPRR